MPGLAWWINAGLLVGCGLGIGACHLLLEGRRRDSGQEDRFSSGHCCGKGALSLQEVGKAGIELSPGEHSRH